MLCAFGCHNKLTGMQWESLNFKCNLNDMRQFRLVLAIYQAKIQAVLLIRLGLCPASPYLEETSSMLCSSLGCHMLALLYQHW